MHTPDKRCCKNLGQRQAVGSHIVQLSNYVRKTPQCTAPTCLAQALTRMAKRLPCHNYDAGRKGSTAGRFTAERGSCAPAIMVGGKAAPLDLSPPNTDTETLIARAAGTQAIVMA